MRRGAPQRGSSSNPGEETIPTSILVCDNGGMVVICAGTSGYEATVDVFPIDEVGVSHQLMHENRHPTGNMAVLVGARDEEQVAFD